MSSSATTDNNSNSALDLLRESVISNEHDYDENESSNDIRPTIDSLSNVSPKQRKWKKYKQYHVDIVRKEGDRAVEIDIFSFARPHMRAFHWSTFCFFIAFIIWFSINPLIPVIRSDLKLTRQEVWTSSIAGVSSTIGVRLILGPLCDIIGPRYLFSFVLCASAIPLACTGLIQTASGLIILRIFVGIAGGSFVMCQYWTSRMFAKEMVGSANGLSAGWGNLGAAIAQLLMSRIFLPIVTSFTDGDHKGQAWRVACLIPAAIGMIVGLAVPFFTDDTPKGNFNELRSNKMETFEFSATTSFLIACKNSNTWILAFQYAACFGVEIALYNAATMYFEDEYGLSADGAARCASVFGWMNLFARGFGGIFSDIANYKYGMKGRIYTQFVVLLMEGLLVMLFANIKSFSGSICVLLSFSLFVQAAEGTSFGIVPYIDPIHTGSVMGIIGAGGNFGAMFFGICFRQTSYYNAFMIMGITIVVSAFTSFRIKI